MGQQPVAPHGESPTLAGQVLDGRYHIGEHIIAAGGMATIYYAIDRRLNREVALKIPHPPLLSDPTFLRRFIKEAQLAAQLVHPNVVTVYDQGSAVDPRFHDPGKGSNTPSMNAPHGSSQAPNLTPGLVSPIPPPPILGPPSMQLLALHPGLKGHNLSPAGPVPPIALPTAAPAVVYLAMEYVNGATLREELAEGGAIPPADALHIFRELTKALAAAHEAGMVHCDVKPENILISEKTGQVKVTDFGLARAFTHDGSTTNDRQMLGTTRYAAPELLTTGQATPRSDVYAAGVVLYEMVTGQLPPAPELSRRPASLPAPSTLDPEIPAWLDELVARSTHTDPQQRPVDGSDLLRHLSEITIVAAANQSEFPATPTKENGTKESATDTTDQFARKTGTAQRADQTGIVPPPLPGPPVSERFASPHGHSPQALAPPARLNQTNPQLAPVGSEQRRSVRSVPAAPVPTQHTVSMPPLALDIRALGKESSTRSHHIFAGIELTKGSVMLASSIAGVTCLVLVLLWMLFYGPLASTTVPTLVGMSLQNAKVEADAANVELKVRQEYSEAIPENVVIDSQPKAGDDIRRNGTVEIVVSLGRELYPVPDLKGKTVNEAQQLLARAQLKLGKQTKLYQPGTVSGQIVSFSPDVGIKVKPGTLISVVISRGEGVMMPDLRNLSLAAATRQLTDLGFKVTSDRRYSQSVRENTVMDQSIAAGERVSSGMTINLTVSRGPSAYTPPPSPTPSVPPASPSLPATVVIPNVVGMPIAQAQQTVQSSGLNVTRLGAGATGIVQSMSPAAGSAAQRGTVVTLITP